MLHSFQDSNFFKIPPTRLSKLKCRYVDHNPLLVIAPVKEEQLYDKPAIYMFHDVITDQEIELMKFLGTPKVIEKLGAYTQPLALTLPC